jgi:nitroreductase/NAD-dependent dihydropyrimidine dehydrogenase PreA subunit
MEEPIPSPEESPIMPRLKLDESRCTLCNLCASDCPARVITLPDSGLPQYVPGGDARCYLCGHCEAICPTAAIAVEDPRLDPRTYPAPGEDAEIAPEKLGAYLRMRRSIRKYRQAPVDRETIDALMDIVRYAPSGINTQSLQWLVVHDTVELRRLTGLAIDWMRHAAKGDSPMKAWFDFEGMAKLWDSGDDPVCRNAPHLVVAHAHRDAMTAPADAFIALAHLDAAAPAFGLGCCWAGLFKIALDQWAPLREALALPEGHVAHYALMLGTPAVRYHRPPKRNPLKIDWR